MKISIVLVEPENPDNIGAVARAMKNMGLRDLRLVSPPRHWKRRGRKMAMKARDVLDGAASYPSLQEAMADSSLVIGTTRRLGAKRGNFISFKEAVKKIRKVSQKKSVAIVFGKESKGLDNPSMRLCDSIMTIPANPDYPSINLAQAVMIVAFSVFNANLENPDYDGRPSREELYVSKEVALDVLKRWKNALQCLEYEREGGPVVERILATFYRLFKRNGLIESEAQMLKGISRRICERIPAPA